VIDLHCHILPAVDDGAADLNAAMSMARALVGAGFRTVAASPHIGTGPGGDVTTAAANQARELLRAELERQSLALEVLPSGEHVLSTELFDRLTTLDVVPIGGKGRWLLTEPPWGGLANLENVLFRLQTKGWRVLLAHPERFDFLSLDTLQRLGERGVRMQLELGSFVGMFGTKTRDRAIDMVEQGIAHVLATDMHRPDDAAVWLDAALKTVTNSFGSAALELGAELNPRVILADGAADGVPPIMEPE
jgi:protein-tyrosine phosphatase